MTDVEVTSRTCHEMCVINTVARSIDKDTEVGGCGRVSLRISENRLDSESYFGP